MNVIHTLRLQVPTFKNVVSLLFKKGLKIGYFYSWWFFSFLFLFYNFSSLRNILFSLHEPIYFLLLYNEDLYLKQNSFESSYCSRRKHIEKCLSLHVSYVLNRIRISKVPNSTQDFSRI